MKTAFCECTFPELPVPKSFHTGRGQGSSNRIAIARAMADVLKKVPKRHITVIKATISLSTVVEEKGEENGKPQA